MSQGDGLRPDAVLERVERRPSPAWRWAARLVRVYVYGLALLTVWTLLWIALDQFPPTSRLVAASWFVVAAYGTLVVLVLGALRRWRFGGE